MAKQKQGPGRNHRKGISLKRLVDMFPDEDSARVWFEGHVWADGRSCPRCGSENTHAASHPKMPYRCRDCRKYFSVKTGTPLEGSPIPLRKWVFAVYLETTSLKGVSSMKLHRDLDVTQKTAWFMLMRVRKAWAFEDGTKFAGPVEVDEKFMGGKRRNMRLAKRKKLTGRGAKGKTAVVGAKDRATKQVKAKVVKAVDKVTLHEFVRETAEPGAQVYTDDYPSYTGLPYPHESVRHSVQEYVRGKAYTNGIESFWATLERAHDGTYHSISPKHLDRYVQRFSGKHNQRDLDTADIMARVVYGLVGKQIEYASLTADNGLSNGAMK